MSEYWVSRKKYFCKYCEIFIADDAPSRNHHENGLRHKGNKERFVRGLYKASERKKKDAEEEKREMARVEQAAAAAYALDVGAGHAKAGSSSSASTSAPNPAPKPSAKPAKPANPYTNYSTAESLGYVDPDLEHIKAEQERRRNEGVVGEWEVVAPAPPPLPADAEDHADGGEEGKGRKREFAVMREVQGDQADEEDARTFKVRKKTAMVGLGEIWDPLDIPIKVKTKKEKDEVAAEEGSSAGTDIDAAAPVKWTTRTWKKIGEADDSPAPEDSAATPPTDDKPEIKQEVPELSVSVKEEVPVKEEALKEETQDAPIPPPSGGMFRKRKIGGGAGAGQGGKRF